MNFVDYCIATKNFSALSAVEDYTKTFGLIDKVKKKLTNFNNHNKLLRSLRNGYNAVKKRGGYSGFGDMLLNLRGAYKTAKENRENARKLNALRNAVGSDQDTRKKLSDLFYKKSTKKGQSGGYDPSLFNLDIKDMGDVAESVRNKVKGDIYGKGVESGKRQGEAVGYDKGKAVGYDLGTNEGYMKGVADQKSRKTNAKEKSKIAHEYIHGSDDD